MLSKHVLKLNYLSRVKQALDSIELTMERSKCPIISTKFSPDSAVLLHLVTQRCVNIPVVWVDTGYNTRNTLQYAQYLTEKLKLNLHIFSPTDHKFCIPPELDSTEHGIFTHEVKIEPFQRALSELKADAWLSSVRKHQSQLRQGLSLFDLTHGGLLKVAPLLDWSEDDILQYRDIYQLPQGPSCYDPTKGEPMRECGLHVSNSF